MFTGLIRYIGKITSIDYTHEDHNEGMKISILVFHLNHVLSVGDSVCVNGICLTVTSLSSTPEKLLTFFIPFKVE